MRLRMHTRPIPSSKYALSLTWACTIYLTASLQVRQLMFSSVRTYLVIQGLNPVRYAYLLLLCNTMLNKCTFLFKNLEHNRHSYYLCIRFHYLKYFLMALLVDEFDSNKNAVIFHYPHLSPYGPAFDGERPIGCVVQYYGFFISASIYWHGFRVFKNSENFSKPFPTLIDAKNFIHSKVNKNRTLFDL